MNPVLAMRLRKDRRSKELLEKQKKIIDTQPAQQDQITLTKAKFVLDCIASGAKREGCHNSADRLFQ